MTKQEYADYLRSVVNRPVMPRDIDTSEYFWDAFGHCETEISAKWIVKFQQKYCKWKPFSDEEIEEFYNKSGYKNFYFNNLIRDGYIIHHDGFNYVTLGFIARCFEAKKLKREGTDV